MMLFRILPLLPLTACLLQAQFLGDRAARREYFVSSTQPELRMPDKDAPVCAALLLPPPERFISQEHREGTRMVHWNLCEMTASQSQAIGAIDGQTVEGSSSASDGYPLIPETGPVNLYPRFDATGVRSIAGVNSLGDLVAITAAHLKTKWPAENLQIISRYTQQSPAPVLELLIEKLHGQIFKEGRYWEKLYIVIGLYPGYFMHTYVQGFYAPGLGDAAPADSEYSSAEPKYASELSSFQNALVLDLQAFYVSLGKSAK